MNYNVVMPPLRARVQLAAEMEAEKVNEEFGGIVIEDVAVLLLEGAGFHLAEAKVEEAAK